MKKAVLGLFIASALFGACKKDTSTPTPPSTPSTPTTKDGFTWKEDGGAEITADSAFWTTWNTGTGIRAYKNGMANFFEVNWDGPVNTGVGTKALVANTGLTFIKGTDTYTNSSAGRINITAFASDKLSGDFTATISGGSIKELSVKFVNLPRK